MTRRWLAVLAIVGVLVLVGIAAVLADQSPQADVGDWTGSVTLSTTEVPLTAVDGWSPTDLSWLPPLVGAVGAAVLTVWLFRRSR